MKINYNLFLSLEHIALSKTAVLLWKENACDAWNLISNIDPLKEKLPLDDNFQFQEDIRKMKWKEMEDKVAQKVKTLLLPEYMKNKVIDYITSIGLQILGWLDFNEELGIPLCNNLMDKLCWAPIGIDNKKTAEELIKDGRLGIYECYVLACTYCLENDIKLLWKKMPEYVRNLFYDKTDPKYVNQTHLVIFWTYYIKGEVSKLNNIIEESWYNSLYQYAFEIAAAGNKTAMEYFLDKLTHQEREESLARTAEKLALSHFDSIEDFRLCSVCYVSMNYSNALYFVLSHMNEDHQEELFTNYSLNVLLCLLDWPWQSNFLEIATNSWSFLSCMDFFDILALIYEKVKCCDSNYNYRNVFRKLWKQSPVNFKSFVINACTTWSGLLGSLFEMRDKENIALMLNYSTPAEKETLIFCRRVICILIAEIFKGNFDLIRFFISECISSKENLVKFRKEIAVGIFMGLNEEWTENITLSNAHRHTKRFFELLDEFISNAE